MKKSYSEQIIEQIDQLQEQYNDQYSVSSEIKALQGVERCIELKMKLWGLDGKTPFSPIDQIEEPPAEIVIDLARLSKQTLHELLDQMK